MTVDLTVPKRWIEGHLTELDLRECDVEHAIFNPASAGPVRQQLLEQLDGIRSTQRAWHEVLRLIHLDSTQHRLREPR